VEPLWSRCGADVDPLPLTLYSEDGAPLLYAQEGSKVRSAVTARGDTRHAIATTEGVGQPASGASPISSSAPADCSTQTSSAATLERVGSGARVEPEGSPADVAVLKERLNELEEALRWGTERRPVTRRPKRLKAPLISKLLQRTSCDTKCSHACHVLLSSSAHATAAT
jgi:hypothetical protein